MPGQMRERRKTLCGNIPWCRESSIAFIESLSDEALNRKGLANGLSCFGTIARKPDLWPPQTSPEYYCGKDIFNHGRKKIRTDFHCSGYGWCFSGYRNPFYYNIMKRNPARKLTGIPCWAFRKARHFRDKTAVRRYVNTAGFFRTLPLIPGSVDAIKTLMEDFDLYIVSAAMEFPLSLYEKKQWLEEHFPFISWKNIVFCGDKSIIKTDYLIDDHLKNLDNFSGIPLLFTASHNVHYRHHHRLNNWRKFWHYFEIIRRKHESIDAETNATATASTFNAYCQPSSGSLQNQNYCSADNQQCTDGSFPAQCFPRKMTDKRSSGLHSIYLPVLPGNFSDLKGLEIKYPGKPGSQSGNDQKKKIMFRKIVQ